MQSEPMDSKYITLNRDELLAFLEIMGVATMSGLADEPLAGLSEEEIKERMNIGRESLISRGLMALEDGEKLVLSGILVALVGGSVFPEATLLLSVPKPDGIAEPHHFNATPEMLIEHYSSSPGVFVFQQLWDIDILVKRLQQLLQTLSATPASDVGIRQEVPASALAQFIAHVKQDNPDRARAVLAETGVLEGVTAVLIKDCSPTRAWVGVTAWGLRGGEPYGGDPVMAILGDERCWLVENVDGKPDYVSIRSASAEDCEKVFLAMVEPLERALEPAE